MENTIYENCPYCYSKKIAQISKPDHMRAGSNITIKCEECENIIDRYFVPDEDAQK
jgi:hypothetical protein